MSLRLPEDITLPFAAYGVLRPGEPAYPRVAGYVIRVEPVDLTGSLFISDGLPLLELSSGLQGGTVRGIVLHFRSGSNAEAYRAICGFEPDKHYEWSLVQTADGSANVLVGKTPQVGSEPWEEHQWSSWRDPVFDYALPVINAVLNDIGRSEFTSAPPHRFEWDRFFRLQMAYLLLWSAIERFCSLAYGPSLDPEEKVRRMEADDRIVTLFTEFVDRQDEVLDARDPKEKYRLSSEDPKACLLYYRQIRNNLSHRGKSAYRDGEKVRMALAELLPLFEAAISACR